MKIQRIFLVFFLLMATFSSRAFAGESVLQSSEAQLAKILVSKAYSRMIVKLREKYDGVFIKKVSIMSDSGRCLDYKLPTERYQLTRGFLVEFERSFAADQPKPDPVVVQFNYDEYFTCSVVPEDTSLDEIYPDAIRSKEI